MPRPKPPEKLLEHCIRLTDTQWAEFQRRGGIAALRETLGKQHSYAEYYALKKSAALRAKKSTMYSSEQKETL